MDLQQRILLYEGKHISLTHKAFEILVTLVENRDRIVSKEELMARVWPDTVVEEINIAKNISLLRKILANGKSENGKDADENDSSQNDSNQYIRTIPKRGYRFIYAVQEVADESPVTSRQPSPDIAATQRITKSEQEFDQIGVTLKTTTSKGKISSRWRYLIGLAVILATGSFLLFGLGKETKSIDLSKLKQTPIHSWKGGIVVESFLVRASPDGNLIAFSKGDAAQTDIYVQQLAGGKTIAVTTEEWPDYSPIWSPDGQKIAYLSRRQDGNELWIIPSLGGKGAKIHAFDGSYMQLLRWSNDGTKIYYLSKQDLFVLNLASNHTSKLTNFDTANPPKSNITVSYDEKRIAYVETVQGSARIFVASLDGSSAFQLTSEGDQNVTPVWFADGRRILYRSKRGDTQQMCIAYLDGRKPVQLSTGHENVFPSFVSTDGNKIFYIATKEESDLYQRDIETDAEMQLTSDAMLKVWPELSFDGKTMVFQQAGNGFNVLHSTLLAKTFDGDGSTSELAADGFDARWSPNGDRLAFLRGENGVYHLWTARNDGADQKQLSQISVLPNGFSTVPYEWTQPNNYSWSPDGKILAFCARQPVAMNVWQVSTDGGTETMVTNNGDPTVKFSSPTWSPDGKRLAYLAQTTTGGKVIRSVMIHENGQSRSIFQTDSRVRMIGFQTRGDYFLAALARPKEVVAIVSLSLVQISVDGKETKPAGQFSSVHFNSPRLSPDGTTLGFVSRQNGTDNIWITSLVNGRSKKITDNTDARLRLSGPVWLPNNKGICFSKQTTSTAIWTMENFN